MSARLLLTNSFASKEAQWYCQGKLISHYNFCTVLLARPSRHEFIQVINTKTCFKIANNMFCHSKVWIGLLDRLMSLRDQISCFILHLLSKSNQFNSFKQFSYVDDYHGNFIIPNTHDAVFIMIYAHRYVLLWFAIIKFGNWWTYQVSNWYLPG